MSTTPPDPAPPASDEGTTGEEALTGRSSEVIQVETGFGSGDPLTDRSTETWAAMSAIFEGYEKELLELSSSITRKAASIPTLTRGA